MEERTHPFAFLFFFLIFMGKEESPSVVAGETGVMGLFAGGRSVLRTPRPKDGEEPAIIAWSGTRLR